MSDTVTIHHGHCSYHGPADKAPAWATREAITEPQHPAPTISPQIDLGPVPAQIVSEGRSATPELFGEGAHENQLTCNGDVITFARKADALSSVRTWASNATSGQSASQRNCAIGDSVPTPLTSFEDTTHAWEEGYRAGREAAPQIALISPEADRDAWVSDLHFNYEGVLAIMLGLSRELHEAGLLGSGLGHPVDLKLPFDLGVLHRELSDIVLTAPVSAAAAAPFGGITFSFCPLSYRRFAEAAKDRVRNSIDRDARGVI